MKRNSTARRGLIGALLAGGSALTIASSALAGGFAVREQSTQFLGTAFAGSAAGMGLSSMFWNPATITDFKSGLWSESNAALILPNSEITALPGSTLCPGLPCESGDIGKDALVPASYYAYALSPNLVLGLAMNSPFGLVTEPSNRFWAGQTHTRTSDIKTFNLNPNVAYRIAPGLSVGVGVQIEWISGRLKNAVGIAPTSANAALTAEDVAIGFTAGVLWKPAAWTAIGLGFRSSIDHNLEGELFLAGIPLNPAGVQANLKTPEVVTLSVRQGITPTLTGLFTVEWTNWSRVQSLDVYCTSVQAAVGCVAPGVLVNSLPLNWHDGWFISGGLEWLANEKLTLRGGLAWERSPIQNPSERTPRVPDNDRIWAALGLTYKVTQNMSVDLAYSHIWIDDGQIDRTASGIRLFADVDSSVDIFSVALKTKLWGGEEPLK
ncbi:MAG: transporter [Hyphomicrobiaceae bacterium]|nr:MAG: transporter [Hyphomicrobiaceae bacterium]